MIFVCVLCHNQAEYIEPMLEALDDFSESIIYMLDKCTDGSEAILRKRGIPYLKLQCKGHGAAEARQRGFEYIMDISDGAADILFLDGDRIPNVLTEAICEDALKHGDIALFRTEDDHRITRNIWKNFTKSKYRVLNCPIYNKDKNAYNPYEFNWDCYVYGCGLLFSNRAMKKIASVQDGYLFNPATWGDWGYEETFTGLVALTVGLKIIFMPDEIRLQGYLCRKPSEKKSYVLKGLRLDKVMTEMQKKLQKK